MQIYVNKIENRVIFKIKHGYKNGENVPHLEITEVNYSEYDEIIVWFTDQKSRALEIEDRINLTMVVK